MIHPDTLAKTFILGGKSDFLPLFQREGLPLESIPAALGGHSAGVSAKQFTRSAMALAAAARERYPSVPWRDLIPTALVNLSGPPTTQTMAGAAEDVKAAFADQGAAEPGSFLAPPLPVHLLPMPRTPSLASPRRPSLELASRQKSPPASPARHASPSRAAPPQPAAEQPDSHPLPPKAPVPRAPSARYTPTGVVSVSALSPRERRHARRPGCLRLVFCCCPCLGCGPLDPPILSTSPVRPQLMRAPSTAVNPAAKPAAAAQPAAKAMVKGSPKRAEGLVASAGGFAALPPAPKAAAVEEGSEGEDDFFDSRDRFSVMGSNVSDSERDD